MKEAALEGTREPARPQVVTEFLCALAGIPLDGRVADRTEEQLAIVMRAANTLDWFALHGCPIVSLDEATANAFASSAPPPEARADEWPLGSAYGIAIGEGSILVRHAIRPTNMPEENQRFFEIADGIIPMEAWSCGVDFHGAEDALTNLIEGIGAAIVSRPTGLAVIERHPSRKAARKQGLDPDRIPSVEWIIGSGLELRARSGPAHEDGSAEDSSDRRLKVRTVVTPHWTHQPYGPRSSLRRLQWIATHWKGPEDAPVSVHATRVLGVRKK